MNDSVPKGKRELEWGRGDIEKITADIFKTDERHQGTDLREHRFKYSSRTNTNKTTFRNIP